jgi:TatD DNase family protein
MPDFIDVHAHVYFPDYDADRDEVMKRAHDLKTWMVNIGTHRETSRKAVELAESASQGVYAVVGLHPLSVNTTYHEQNRTTEFLGEDFDSDYYRQLVRRPKVVGIGECGLDYFRENSEEGKIRQRDAFQRQIELSLESGLPLMLHVRNAYEDVIDILKKYPGVYGNCHFFAGTIAHAKELLDLGFTLSFTGVITFAKQYEELVRYVPLDRLLSETDSPYVAPVPYRGKRNEPSYVREVVSMMASIRKEDPLSLQKQLVANAVRLFRL